MFCTINLGSRRSPSSKRSIISFINEVMFLDGNPRSLLENNFLNMFTLLDHLQDIKEVSLM